MLSTNQINNLWYNNNSLESCSNNSPSLTDSIFYTGENKMATKNISKICSVVDCGKNSITKNYCENHYRRWLRYGNPTAPTPKRKISDVNNRFWSKVVKTDNCWLWQASKNEHGYGKFRAERKSHRAHIFAWYLTFGEFPKSYLLHSCDTPACVNPAHLREGTKAENSADMVAKNRSAKGEFHSQSVLTEKEVLEIREKFKNGQSAKSLALDYGVSTKNIWNIAARKTWTHI
jgi:hypothetical protein